MEQVRKEKLLSKAELSPFQNQSSQMAALDYLVSIASDVFIPTYYGNMAKVVEGHRRYLCYSCYVYCKCCLGESLCYHVSEVAPKFLGPS